MCTTLRRVCHHIRDFSPKPGYVPFAADRLRVLAGELCDWGDSYYAAGAAPPAARVSPQVEPEREFTEASAKAEIPNEGTDNKASAATTEVTKAPKEKKEKTHRGHRESGHRKEKSDRPAPVKKKVSEDSA